MQTQISCPRCQTPYVAEVHQIIDADQRPDLKQRLLSGQLNVAVCPNCGAGGQLTTPLLYHDADHELFMVYMPMEISLPQMEREQLIGELTRRAMEDIPQEKRRAYILQPQTIINMQTFMEKVLETEGITPEMIARQKKQSELLRTLLATDDKEEVNRLLEERADEIDETFLAMLKQSIEIASQAESEVDVIKMINLQARLYRDTPAGQQMERQQIALHAFSREAKQEGLSPKLLARHITANDEDEALVQNLAMAGQQAMTYKFFQELTKEVRRRRKAGNDEAAARLEKVRDELNEFQQALQAQSRQILEQADASLQKLLTADDQQTAVRQALENQEIDDPFMYVLEARIAQAHEQRQQEQAEALEEIQALIQDEVEGQMPPEIMLLNQLVQAESTDEQARLLDENPQMVTPQMMQLLDAVEEQVMAGGGAGVDGRFQQIKEMIAARL